MKDKFWEFIYDVFFSVVAGVIMLVIYPIDILTVMTRFIGRRIPWVKRFYDSYDKKWEVPTYYQICKDLEESES